MATYAIGGDSADKHSFADTEIEIAAEGRIKAILFWRRWEIKVVATMRPRRPLSRLWRKTATDTADRIVLQVHFPLCEGVDPVITEIRSIGSVSAMCEYATNPWSEWGRGWRFWRTRQCVIRYGTQVEYLGNTYAFSGELTISEPTTD